MTNPLEKDDEFQMSLANPNPSFKARKDGDHYFIDFELSKEEWDWFVDPNIDRTGMVVEVAGRVTHRAVKGAAQKEKGGPLAKWAGILCSDPEFWSWLNEVKEIDFLTPAIGKGETVKNEQDARRVILFVCAVESRRFLDHNPRAARAFREQVMAPFDSWRGAQGR